MTGANRGSGTRDAPIFLTRHPIPHAPPCCPQRNDTAFVCPFFGPASDADTGTFRFVESVINGIHGTESHFIPQWPMNNIGPDNLPAHVHGFVLNDVVDFNSQNPPLHDLPICTGPTLNLTAAQRVGQIIIMANITTVDAGRRSFAAAADALTNLYRTGLRCVITFVSVEQPRSAWLDRGNALFQTAMMFNSFACLEEAFLSPSVPATAAAVTSFMRPVKLVELIVTGMADDEYVLFERSLLARRQGLQVRGRLEVHRSNGYQGYMANRIVNPNCNSLTACPWVWEGNS
jgi:hypothetical protein